MKVCWQLAFLSVLASSLEADCRRLNGLLDVRNKKRSDELISFEYLVKPSEKEGASFGGRSPKLDPHR